jgi:hypothetical protein
MCTQPVSDRVYDVIIYVPWGQGHWRVFWLTCDRDVLAERRALAASLKTTKQQRYNTTRQHGNTTPHTANIIYLTKIQTKFIAGALQQQVETATAIRVVISRNRKFKECRLTSFAHNVTQRYAIFQVHDDVIMRVSRSSNLQSGKGTRPQTDAG